MGGIFCIEKKISSCLKRNWIFFSILSEIARYQSTLFRIWIKSSEERVKNLDTRRSRVFKFFMISEDDFMKILKRVRGWVQFLINNTTWQNWACLDAAFVVRHCTYSEEFEKLWTIWEIVNNFKLFTIASLIWIKTATVTVTISAWACCFCS